MKNLLIKSDNLKALNYLLKHYKNKIDLIYIDPPFATGNIFRTGNSTLSNSKLNNIAYNDKFELNEFINFLKQRIEIMYKLLSDKGSFYIHTDYKVGHYVKVMCDKIFGIKNFKNDISRIKTSPKNFKRIGYGNIKDMILFYVKTDKSIWNEPILPYTKDDIKELFKKKDKNGKYYTTISLHAPGETKNTKKFKGLMPPSGRHWRTNIETLEQWDKEGKIEWSSTGNPRKIMYSDERKGKRVQDIWKFKDNQKKTLYPTQKNIKLLDLIIKTSSDKNSIILDAFCGSGTTLKSAEEHNRTWIGIDNSDIAIKTVKKRIKNEYKFMNF